LLVILGGGGLQNAFCEGGCAVGLGNGFRLANSKDERLLTHRGHPPLNLHVRRVMPQELPRRNLRLALVCDRNLPLRVLQILNLNRRERRAGVGEVRGESAGGDGAMAQHLHVVAALRGGGVREGSSNDNF
jgi:hypothetical protein